MAQQAEGKNMRSKRTVFVLALFAAALASVHETPVVHAGPAIACFDAALRPRVVYMSGSSALKPFLGPLQQVLSTDSSPYTIVYQSQGSCTGVGQIYGADPTARVITGVGTIFNPDGTTQDCALDAPGDTVDLGISDVFADSCGAQAPAGVTITDYLGPIQAMTLVVPSASSQRSISAEAAYEAFGLGGGAAAPWTEPSYFFVRNAKSGTQQMVARAIGVPAEQWWGTDRKSADGVRLGLKVILDAPTAEKSIGIVSADYADPERGNLRTLAFQAKGQLCGFLPDSTETSLDKANVRDGHYPIWGPIHFFARTNAGDPGPAAAAVISHFNTPKVEKALLDAEIAKSLVPQCAMNVTRSTELGPMGPFTPSYGCGCYFDSVVSGKSSCQKCTLATDCPSTAPACNYGYCEVR
jgi:hypothetical protein